MSCSGVGRRESVSAFLFLALVSDIKFYFNLTKLNMGFWGFGVLGLHECFMASARFPALA